MVALKGFDANQVEPTSDFEPIPAGKYVAVITETEVKANKAGTPQIHSMRDMLCGTVHQKGARKENVPSLRCRCEADAEKIASE